MLWLRVFCFAAALVWTALMFLAYRDLGLAVQSSLIGWLFYGVVWFATRSTPVPGARSAPAKKKPPVFRPRNLAIAGAVAGLAVTTILTAQWLAKRESVATAIKPVTQAPPARSEPLSQPVAVAAAAPAQKSAGMWSVQVGAFKNEHDAIKIVKGLKQRGWEAYITSADVRGVTFYRANVGRFRTRGAAEQLLLRLKDKEAYRSAFVASM